MNNSKSQHGRAYRDTSGVPFEKEQPKMTQDGLFMLHIKPTDRAGQAAAWIDAQPLRKDTTPQVHVEPSKWTRQREVGRIVLGYTWPRGSSCFVQSMKRPSLFKMAISRLL